MAHPSPLRTPLGTRFSVVLCCMLVVLLAASLALAPATAQELTILRYEPLADLAITEPSGAANGEPAAAGPTISFTAFGTPFSMTLARNEALTHDLPAAVQAQLGSAEFYTGALAGNADSWVRLTRAGAVLSGALWDGSELYAIEQYERVAAHVVAGPAVAPSDLIIYRWADTLSALTDAVASPPVPDGAAAQKPAGAPALFDELAEWGKLTPPRQLNIGLLADAEFVLAHGPNSQTNMLSVANIVDGIFFDQLGVRINVAELRAYGVEPDAFTGTNASALLTQLGEHKLATPALRPQGLVHLITGRDLDERADAAAGTRLLGVARLGVLCEAGNAVGLTQYTDLGTAAVVAAHEIGHNFGAPHDTEAGSRCEAAPDYFLMAPFVNGSRQFSSCSVQQMEIELATASCLTNLPSNDLSVQPLSSLVDVPANRPFGVSFALDFNGAVEPLDGRLTIARGALTLHSLSLQAPATCGLGSPVVCTFQRFGAGGGRLPFSAEFVATQLGPASIEVEVTSLNDYQPANNRYRFDFNVVQNASFVLDSVVASRTAVRPGEPFEIDWVVRNVGQTPATGVRAELPVPDVFGVIDVQTSSGAIACSRDPASYDNWLCPIGTLGAGGSLPLKLRARAREVPGMSPGSRTGGFVALKLFAVEPIFNYQNSWAAPNITITPSISDLYVDLTAPSSAHVGSKVTLTLRGGNRGPDSVDNAGTMVRTWAGRGLTFDSATNSRGTCATSWLGELACELGTLASGDTFEVVVEATVAAEEGTHDLFGSAGAPSSFDSDGTNNEDRMLFSAVAAQPTAAPPAAPTPILPAPTEPAGVGAGSGGGGGGVDLAWLLLLLGAAARRSSRARCSLLRGQRGVGTAAAQLRRVLVGGRVIAR